MKQSRRPSPVLVNLVVLALALAGCSEDGGSPSSPGGAGGAPGSGGRGAGGSGSGGAAAGTGGAGQGGSAPGTGGAAAGTGGSGARDGGAADGAGSGGGGGGGSGDASVGGETPPANAALAAACTPTFKLTQTDTGPKGMIFTEAVNGNAEAFVQQIGREVCRVLYRQASEVRAANSIELEIKDTDGVAAKWGDIGDIGVEISTRHLQNVKNQGRDVKAEISGILHHEMTHMYQNDDKPEGTFAGLPNMYEGIADAVRIRNGFPPAGASPGGKQGTWQQKTYVEQAFFWLWIDTAYPDFIYKLNASMKGRDNTPWTPAEIQKITGKTADALWTEYQGAACCQGANRACCK